MPLTPEERALRLEEIRQRCEKATPGPWQTRFLYRVMRCLRKHAHEDHLLIGTAPEKDWDDCDFAAAARSDVPFLLAELAKAERRLEQQQTFHEEDNNSRWSTFRQMMEALGVTYTPDPGSQWTILKPEFVRNARAETAESHLARLRAAMLEIPMEVRCTRCRRTLTGRVGDICIFCDGIVHDALLEPVDAQIAAALAVPTPTQESVPIEPGQLQALQTTVHELCATIRFFASVIKSGERWSPACQESLEAMHKVSVAISPSPPGKDSEVA